MKAKAPIQAPSIRTRPPITAMISSLIVCGRSTSPGATARVPDVEHTGQRGEESGEAECHRPVERDGVAERAHPHRLVAYTLQATPNGVRTM